MSNFPTPLQGEFNPQLAFDNILHSISSHLPHLRKPDILPHLQKFLAHPDIRALLREGVTPFTPLAPSPSAELQEICTTLKTLTQAVASIQKALPSPNNAAHAEVSPASWRTDSCSKEENRKCRACLEDSLWFVCPGVCL